MTGACDLSDGELALAILRGERLLSNGTHWANRTQRDEVEKRVAELREELARREPERVQP